MQHAAELDDVVTAEMTEGARLLDSELTRRKWSQTTLSEHLGVSKGHVSRWLSGARRPSLRWAVELEKVLGIPHQAWLLKAETLATGR
jgi:plasmid maintenance system antidote protein VapI